MPESIGQDPWRSSGQTTRPNASQIITQEQINELVRDIRERISPIARLRDLTEPASGPTLSDKPGQKSGCSRKDFSR